MFIPARCGPSLRSLSRQRNINLPPLQQAFKLRVAFQTRWQGTTVAAEIESKHSTLPNLGTKLTSETYFTLPNPIWARQSIVLTTNTAIHLSNATLVSPN